MRSSMNHTKHFATILLMALLAACGGGSGGGSSGTATLKTITVTAPAGNVPKGSTAQLSATGTYSDGSQRTLADASWSSSATGVATVDSAGRVSGVDLGSATITAEAKGIAGSLAVNVTAPVVISIAVTPSDPFVAKGVDRQLTATGSFSDGSTQDLTDAVTWSSSEPSRMTVGDTAGSKGLASFVKVGAVTLTATDVATGVSGSVTVQARHVMFVTSTSGTADLGSWGEASGATGLAAGDAVCQARATAAGLDGTFKAWLSDETDDAYCRVFGLGGQRSTNCGQATLPIGAGPWIRTDGHPFSEAVENLANANYVYAKTYTTARFNESGAAESDTAWAYTGTGWNGTSEGVIPCGNWTNTTGTAPKMGKVSYAAPYWTSHGGSSCADQQHLLCFQTGAGSALPSFAAAGKKVFISSAYGTGNLSAWSAAGGQTGIAAGDAICRTLATNAGLANAANFKAWLSDSVTSAKDRFVTTDAPYVRLDGVKVADNLTALVSGSLFTAINLSDNGQTVANSVWTGTASNGTALTTHCADWTNGTSGVKATTGAPQSAGASWTDYNLSSCNYAPGRLYCMED